MSSWQLNTKDRMELIGVAHSLKPVVIVGHKGLTESVVQEIDHALTAHELIKIRISCSEDKAERKLYCEKIAGETTSIFLRLIGNIGIFYRSNPDE